MVTRKNSHASQPVQGEAAKPLEDSGAMPGASSGSSAEVAPEPPPPSNPAPPSSQPDPLAPFGRKADGTPAKKRGAPAGPRARPDWVRNPVLPGGHDPRVLAAQTNAEKYKATAEMIVNVTTSGLESALSPEWRPASVEEKKFLTDATFEYLKAKGLPDLPPGWVLLCAVGIYAFPRVTNAEVQAKFLAILGRK